MKWKCFEVVSKDQMQQISVSTKALDSAQLSHSDCWAQISKLGICKSKIARFSLASWTRQMKLALGSG